MVTEQEFEEIYTYDVKDCEIELEDVDEKLHDLRFRMKNCTSSVIIKDLQDDYLDLQERRRRVCEQYKKLTNRKY